MKNVIDENKRIRVIGDVHGDFQSFSKMVEEALVDDRFILQLGDLEDRGPEPANCIELMMELVDAGNGMMTLSNHGWKHYRHYIGRSVKLNQTHIDTQSDINAKGDAFVERYVQFMETVPHYIRYGNNYFAHAAYHSHENKDELTNSQIKTFKERCIYGMSSGRENPNTKLPIRLLDWFDWIPEDMNVFVGHHVLSTTDILNFKTTGGNAYFVDLGCQSRDNGTLAYVDMDAGVIVNSSHPVKFSDDPTQYGDYHNQLFKG